MAPPFLSAVQSLKVQDITVIEPLKDFLQTIAAPRPVVLKPENVQRVNVVVVETVCRDMLGQLFHSEPEQGSFFSDENKSIWLLSYFVSGRLLLVLILELCIIYFL